MSNKKNLYFAVPYPANKRYHVFDENNKSLCGVYAMLKPSDDIRTPVKGTEVYIKGQDCKSCFKKAGLT